MGLGGEGGLRLTEEATPANPKNGAYGGQSDMVKERKVSTPGVI